MPELLEYFGVFLAAGLCRCHNNNLVMRLGEPDAFMRRGVKDNLLYKADRVLDYASGRLWEAPAKPPTFYTFREGARFVGITEQVAKRIFPKETPAILIPDQASEPHRLYPEPWLIAVRKMIATGDIKVNQKSLTKPRMGARLTSPRHVWADQQTRETEQLQRTSPLDYVIW
jgi:hypothetical protein